MSDINKGARIINHTIDYMVIICITIFFSIFFYPTQFLYLVVYISYYFFLESFNNGQTLGKLITKTKVIGLNNKKPSSLRIFWRSVLRLNPFDILSFLCGQNGHDSISRTKLISVK
ncbi:RDD family protein [uncultured Tenacibaculum sp.]|uniref:RDD family protein n=1 Tax=uncultured Tenacibaculum sp. TaxID=174713 RepID=UPI002625F9CC|nr:RDD family protein [uncultured Tenacibaculum sp.]